MSKSTERITRPESAPEAVGRRLRELRRGQSQRGFAARLGMKPQQLNRYEKGRIPASDVLSKIARTAGVTVDWILTGVETDKDIAATAAPDRQARSWQGALEPYLAGSPLEGSLGRLAMTPDDSHDRAWRELDEDRKREVIRTLRGMATVAVVVAQMLPPTLADEINDDLADRVSAYLADAF